MKKWLCFLLLSSCAFGATDRLKIGTISLNPPFEMLADDAHHLLGFEIDVMDAICRRLDVHCDYVLYTFDDLFQAMRDEKIDLAFASLIITGSRYEEFLFSVPYLPSYVQYLTVNQAGHQTAADLLDKKIGIRKTPSFKQLLLKENHRLQNIIEYPSTAAMLIALQNRAVEAVLMSSWSAIYWASNNSDLYKAITPRIEIGYGYGMMTRKSNTYLMAKVNQELMKMQQDGTIKTIYDEYFGKLMSNAPS